MQFCNVQKVYNTFLPLKHVCYPKTFCNFPEHPEICKMFCDCAELQIRLYYMFQVLKISNFNEAGLTLGYEQQIYFSTGSACELIQIYVIQAGYLLHCSSMQMRAF